MREWLVEPDYDQRDCLRASQLRDDNDDLDSAVDNDSALDNHDDAIA